jgi:hypothetical protein
MAELARPTPNASVLMKNPMNFKKDVDDVLAAGGKAYQEVSVVRDRSTGLFFRTFCRETTTNLSVTTN